MLFFYKGLIRHLIIWKTLHFKALTQLWLSTVKASALPKERWRKSFALLSLPKVGAHNRVPSKQLYYWVTEPLMRYPLEKLFGCCFFFNKGLVRHLIIWETLRFKALTQLWLSTVKASALPKERWRKSFALLSLPKVGAHNRVPSKQLYYWVTEPLMRYPLEKLSGCCFFFYKGLTRHLTIWKTLHFKTLTQLWLSTVKASNSRSFGVFSHSKGVGADWSSSKTDSPKVPKVPKVPK